MAQLKGFGIAQTAKVMAVLYFFVAVIFVIVAIPLMLIGRSFGMSGAEGGMPGFGFGIVFLIVAPFLYALAAYLCTAIGCAIYNLVASKVGGIEVDLTS